MNKLYTEAAASVTTLNRGC